MLSITHSPSQGTATPRKSITTGLASLTLLGIRRTVLFSLLALPLLFTASLSATLPPLEIANKVATVAKAIDAPAIDGDIDAVWQTAPENIFNQHLILSGETTELSGTWQALWDKDNLYILLKVLNNNPGAKFSSYNGFVIYTSANYTRKDFTFNPAYERLSDTALYYEVGNIRTKATLYGDLSKPAGVGEGPVANPTLFYYDDGSRTYLPRWPSNGDGIQQPGELPDPTVSSDEQRLIDDPNYFSPVYSPKTTYCMNQFSLSTISLVPTIACIQSTADGYRCEISIPWIALTQNPNNNWEGNYLRWDGNAGYFSGGTGAYADSIRDYLGFEFTLFATSEVGGNITNMLAWCAERPAMDNWYSTANEVITEPIFIGGDWFAKAATSVWGTLQLLPAPSILGTDCVANWAVFEGGFKWHNGIGFVYDAYYPYVYLFDSQNWLYIFERDASESTGFYLYDFSRGQLGISGCSYYPNYLPANSDTLIPLVNPN
ncbi:MAG: sugar-binding protein [Verrucomicrobiota bacterium]|nr:sugar-binding protein [Verrucomicrobiota bacterium]